jgi:hypothetical protein
MLTTNQAEFLIAVFIAWWWVGALYSATSHKKLEAGRFLLSACGLDGLLLFACI